MNPIVVNTRPLAEPVTGIQRYMQEILSRLGSAVDRLAPASRTGGARGLLWDQLVLPRWLQGRLLWSPSSTGPLSVAQQVVTVHDVIALDHPEWFHPVSAELSRLILPRPGAARPAHHRCVGVYPPAPAGADPDPAGKSCRDPGRCGSPDFIPALLRRFRR